MTKFVFSELFIDRQGWRRVIFIELSWPSSSGAQLTIRNAELPSNVDMVLYGQSLAFLRSLSWAPQLMVSQFVDDSYPGIYFRPACG